MSAIQDSIPVPGTVNGTVNGTVTVSAATASSVPTTPAKPPVRLTDSTLRDGSHAVAHQFTLDQVVAIAGALDAAGVQIIEVTHGDGLSGSTFNYGFGRHTDAELVATAVQTVDRAKIAVLVLPGLGTVENLREVHGVGAEWPGSPPTPPRPMSRSSISGRRVSWEWKPLAS